jgi:hypothetical protein
LAISLSYIKKNPAVFEGHLLVRGVHALVVLRVTWFNRDGAAVFEAVLDVESAPEQAGALTAVVPGSEAALYWGAPSLWLAFRYSEHGTTTLVDFSTQRQQRLARELQAQQRTDTYGEVRRDPVHLCAGKTHGSWKRLCLQTAHMTI